MGSSSCARRRRRTRGATFDSCTRENRRRNRIFFESRAAMLKTLTRELLTASVLAVPPLARSADLSLNEAENRKLIRHIEAGGVRTLLYGGNANFYHLSLAEYDSILSLL